jgi:inner membrane protein
MSWVFWMLFGIALLVFEVLTPGGFFTVFFGLAAFFIAFLTWLGLFSSGPAQWLGFALSGTVLVVALRPLVRRMFEKDTPKVDQMVGQTAIALDSLDSNGRGKVELRGASWNAHYPGTGTVLKGDRLRVTRVDGLSLIVEKE